MCRIGFGFASMVFVGAALVGCTYFQTRSMHEFEGVVISVADGRPVAGATLVLFETRHYSAPWGTGFFQPIAHASTDSVGRFDMKVCMTERQFRLEWSPGMPGLNVPYPEWTRRGDKEWFVKIYTEPGTPRSIPLEAYLEEEDSSFVNSCSR